VTSEPLDYLSVEDLVILAETVLRQRPVIRDPGLLAAAAARPSAVIFGHTAYPTLFGKAAALLFSICQNHALLDGNKRLAWSAAVAFLALNGVPVPDVDVDAAEDFVLSVAKGQLTEVAQIEAALLFLYGRS
jgi:death on curing protein